MTPPLAPGPLPGCSPGWTTATGLADLGELTALWLDTRSRPHLAHGSRRWPAVTRPRRVRAFASELESRFGGRFEASYDTGGIWCLNWVDGPSRTTVRALADKVNLAGATLWLHRGYSMKALALTAIRMAAAGKLGRFDGSGDLRSGPLWIVESQVEDAKFPERPDDDLQPTPAQ